MSFTHYRIFEDEASAKQTNAEIAASKNIPSRDGTTLRWSDVEDSVDGRFLIASPDGAGAPIDSISTMEAVAEASGDMLTAERFAERRLARRERQDGSSARDI